MLNATDLDEVSVHAPVLLHNVLDYVTLVSCYDKVGGKPGIKASRAQFNNNKDWEGCLCDSIKAWVGYMPAIY